MKIILSRKGFDSANGGIVSPIFEDGTMVSFPIPSDDEDTYRYLRDRNDFYRGKDLQVIWGYLQVGEIISVPEEQRKVWWHPHSSNGRADNSTNVIFKAAERLSLDKSKPGAGVLRFDKKRVLTLKGATKATWARNEVYDETHIYGKRSNCAKNPDSGLYYAGIWQELGLKESDACTEWARNILL